LRIGAGGRRVGIQNEGVMRRREAGRKERQGGRGGRRERERPRDQNFAGVGAPLWDSRRWDEGSQPILYYTTLQ